MRLTVFRDQQPTLTGLRAQVWARTAGRCWYCGVRLSRRFHVDHFVPRARGGGDGFANRVPACEACNCRKGALNLEAFRRLEEARRPPRGPRFFGLRRPRHRFFFEKANLRL